MTETVSETVSDSDQPQTQGHDQKEMPDDHYYRHNQHNQHNQHNSQLQQKPHPPATSKSSGKKNKQQRWHTPVDGVSILSMSIDEHSEMVP